MQLTNLSSYNSQKSIVFSPAKNYKVKHSNIKYERIK